MGTRMISVGDKESRSDTYVFCSRRPSRVKPLLRLRITERKLLLYLMDLLIINAALIVALALRSDYTPRLAIIIETAKWFVALSAIWLITATFYDCYDLARAASTSHSLRNCSLAVLSTGLVYTLTPFVTPALQSRSFLFLFGMVALLGICTWRAVYAQFFIQPQFEQRALVIGAGERGQALVEMLTATSHDANPFRGTGYRIVGFVDDRVKESGLEIE